MYNHATKMTPYIHSTILVEFMNQRGYSTIFLHYLSDVPEQVLTRIIIYDTPSVLYQLAYFEFNFKCESCIYKDNNYCILLRL